MLVRPSAGLSNEQKGALKNSPAATMPAPGGPRHGDDRDDRDGPDFRPREPRGDQFRGPPTTQEREEAIEFFRQHMKYRMQIFDRLPEGRPARARMMQMMMERYRRLQRVRMEDSAMFDLMLAQMQLQDNALDVMQQQREQRANQEEVDRLQGVLREKVKQIIELSLQERQARIDRLEKQLAEQKARLEQDLANPEALVDQHMLQMRQDADEVRKIRQNMGLGGPGRFGPPPRQSTTDQAERSGANR